jgi:hypothetical protein
LQLITWARNRLYSELICFTTNAYFRYIFLH